MTKKTFLLVSTVFWFICITVNAEPHDDFVCQTLSVSGGEAAALSGGIFKPSSNQSGEYFRALFVFVQFEGDTRSNSEWPLDSLPIWAYDFIDSSPSSNYRNITFSDYWADMSMDNFDFVGDVYPELVILPSESSYSQNNENYDDCNLDVLAAIDENVDFGLYDNWKLESGQFIFSESGADNLVDMIYIIYRNPGEATETNWFGGFTAIAHLGFGSNYTTDDTTSGGNIVQINGTFGSSGSGITVRQGLRGHYDLIERCAHEYGHYLFGAGHSNYTGIMGGETYALSGWERIELGYVTPIVPTTDGETAILGDFIKDGGIVKIPVPFDNPSSSTFFLVENHQRDSPYDQIMRGGAIGGAHNFTTTLGRGVYIWLITGGNSHPINVIPKTADGAWNWTYVGDFPAPGMFYQYPFGDHVPMTIRESINRDGDKTDRNPDHIEWNGLTVAKWCDINPVTKEWELTRNVMGDEYDAFNIDYNELFTPWSNSSSYASGATNISVELISQDQYGNITLKVYSTEASALDLPPSKPQGLSVDNETEIDFGGNYTATSRLEWFHNDEPDMDYYKVYKATTTGSAPSLNEYAFVCTTAVNSIELPITDFGDTKKIYYRITAVDTDGNESVKSEGNWDWSPPTQPSISISRYEGHPRISWSAPETSEIDVYLVRNTRFMPGSPFKVQGTFWIDWSVDWPIGQVVNQVNYYYYVYKERRINLQSPPSDEVTAWEKGGWFFKEGIAKEIPQYFGIEQNYPNPFNPTTVIKYQLPEAVNVTIKLYDMLGREVKEFINDTQEAGYYELNFDGSDLASGTYIYRITAGDFTDSKKLLLLK